MTQQHEGLRQHDGQGNCSSRRTRHWDCSGSKSLPERLSSFLKDVRSEMRKVITPSRQEVQATTTVVIVTVFIFAAYFWLVDNIIGRAIEARLITI